MGHLSIGSMVIQNKTRKGTLPCGAYCPAENRDEHQAIGLQRSEVGLRVLLEGHQPHLAQGRMAEDRRGSMSKCRSDNLQMWDEKTLVREF